LTKKITHLISFRTDGAKYTAAKNWIIQIVSIEWLRDSLERGMILDETLYDPVLPVEKRGIGAWDKTKPKKVSLGKRSRDASVSGLEGAKRKLRRTASTKLNSQSEQLWGNITGGANFTEVERSGVWDAQEVADRPSFSKPQNVLVNPSITKPTREPPEAIYSVGGIFNECRFYFHAFPPKKVEVLCGHLLPQGAEVARSLEDLTSISNLDPPTHLFMIVPHDLPVSEHPELPISKLPIRKITVWWVERCLHTKKFIDPQEHIVGRPFPVFPIERFQGMTICSSAFSGIDLLHFKNSVELIGAQYSEDMTPQSSVLVTKSQTGLRKDKYEHAVEWKIPIVAADWLWACIARGVRLEPGAYTFRSKKLPNALPPTTIPLKVTEIEGQKEQDSEKNSPSQTNGSPPKAQIQSVSPPPPPVVAAAPATTDEVPNIEQENAFNAPPKEIQASDATSEEASFKAEPLPERDPNSPSQTVSTAPAPSGHPHSKSIQHDYSSGISDLLVKTRRSAQPTSNEASEGIRKRAPSRIFGRVASNLSATSASHSRATSVDSTATHNNGVETAPTKDNQLAMFLNGDRSMDKDIDSQPPSTQLQYEDPESAEVTERVMARMLGEKLPPKRTGLKKKAITITSLADMETRTRTTRQKAR
jgi:DNA replication regulator DPB11